MTDSDQTQTSPGVTTGGIALPNKWLVLALLLGIAVFNHADRYLLAGLVEPIKAEFGVSDSFMGLLMGPAFAVFYSTLAIPIAIYADRASRIAIITVGCIVWSAFTVLSGFAADEWQLAAARVGVGVGEAAFAAPAYSLIAAYFTPDQRGRAFAVIALAVYFGQMLGYGGGPAIANYDDWRLAFKVMGAGGLVVILIAWLIIREPSRNEGEAEVRVPILPLLAQLTKRRSYLLMTFGMAAGVMSGISFGLWGPTLFARSYEMTLTDAGAAFGSAFTLPGIIGALLFGFIADRMTKHGYDKMLVLSAIGLTLATIAVVAAIWAASVSSAVLWAIPAGLFGGGWAVGIYAGLQYILPDRLRATGTAISMLALNLLGYVVGPWLVGVLSDGIGGENSLQLALTIVVPVGVIGAALLWIGRNRLDHDRSELERVSETMKTI